MSIISFRCHTTIHLAPLVNQETIHQDMDRGQQLMSRINQGILREIKPKNPLVEWYYWKDKHTVSDVTEHSLFKMASHGSEYMAFNYRNNNRHTAWKYVTQCHDEQQW